MVILRPVVDLGLSKKRLRQSIAGLDQTRERFLINRITQNKEAVPIERLSLIRFELNEIQVTIRPQAQTRGTLSWPSLANTVSISMNGKAVSLDLTLQL